MIYWGRLDGTILLNHDMSSIPQEIHLTKECKALNWKLCAHMAVRDVSKDKEAGARVLGPGNL